MTSTISMVLGSIAAAYMFLSALLRCTQDSREPPAIETSIPFLSPLFGLISGMQDYTVKLRNKYQLPIYTLRLPGQRMYIINSLALIPPLQRQHKALAFAPIEAQAAANVMGVGVAGNAIIGSDKMMEPGSYLQTFIPYIAPALSPGPGLDTINGAAISYISGSLSKIKGMGSREVELFSWIRHEIFMATTEAIYGPKNPFRDPVLEKAWYTFEPTIMTHMLKAWPSVLARKALQAREHLLIPAFEKYFAENSHLQGSLLVQCRYKHNIDHGLRGRDMAATEIGNMIASLTNSAPAAFWMIYHLFSDPEILRECRKEVEQLVTIDDKGFSTVDLAKVKTLCPVLFSTWQETLRYEHIGVVARVVMEDTLFDEKYLLKKGATVTTVTSVLHSDLSVWGLIAKEFNHQRFLKVLGEKRSNPRPAVFRAFGGGNHLCPGRHFVSTEVLSLTALMILYFELRPIAKNSQWEDLRKYAPMTAGMSTPKDELMVEIFPRDDRELHVEFSGSSKAIEMVAEDAIKVTS